MITIDELIEREDLHLLPEAELADLIQPFVAEAMRPDKELKEAMRKKTTKSLNDILKQNNDLELFTRLLTAAQSNARMRQTEK